jgi:large subunit ribosomal protein L21
MYAIFENGSHQFRVQEGDRVTIDKRPEEPGSEVVFDKVLLIAGHDGSPHIGSPYVGGATVVGTIERTYRGRKVIVRKFKRRKNYRRKRGHRQTYTTVLIKKINAA